MCSRDPSTKASPVHLLTDLAKPFDQMQNFSVKLLEAAPKVAADVSSLTVCMARRT